MILLLRGHIRSSFNCKRLYNFIKILHEIYSIEIYIHTWNLINSQSSWKNIETNNDLQIVNEDLINNYFNDLNFLIKNIIIDDETKINLEGDLTGTVCKSKCKKIYWKRYLYGQYKNIEYINYFVKNRSRIINTRFDIFNNTNYFTEQHIILFINKQKNKIINKNIFISDKLIFGIDNIIYGNIYTMYKLLKHLYLNLDRICLIHPKLLHQEYLFFTENEIIFPSIEYQF